MINLVHLQASHVLCSNTGDIKLNLLLNEAVVVKRNNRFVVAIGVRVCDRLLLGLCSFEMIPQLPYLPIDL